MTQEQYDNAARAVHVALQERNSTSNRRLHIDRYKPHAAEVLNIKAVYPAKWAEVIAAGERLQLFKVDRETLQKPIFVDIKQHQPTSETPERVRLDLGLHGHSGESLTFKTYALYEDNTPYETTFDEDTSDEPTVPNTNQAHTHGAILYRLKVPANQPWFTDGVFEIAAPRLAMRFERLNKNSAYDAVISYFTPPTD